MKRVGRNLALAAGALGAAMLWQEAGAAAPGGPSLGTTLLEAERRSGGAFAIAGHLTDSIGPRLSGSEGAEAAVAWAVERMRRDGFDARTEPVMVPHWVRGGEEAELLAPARQRLVVTALGNSVPTPEGGIEAEVVEANGLADMARVGESARGRIVLFNQPMPVADFENGYGVAVPQRTRGAVEAARHGALAVLVRSVGTLSARLPHTGTLVYDPAVPPIPAAAMAAEDADLIHRHLAAGARPRVRLRLGCRMLPDAPSANVVVDLPGRERPQEIVLLAAHLDSWDLGTGAIDDAGGVAMVLETLRLLKGSGYVPRRTVRAVLYMNEENGLRGGIAYAKAHASELLSHVAAVECDSGTARPLGFRAFVGTGGLAALAEAAPGLEPLGAAAFRESEDGGADIGPLKAGGVPLFGLEVDPTHYFDWHHTAADTLDKIDPDLLARDTAAVATLAYFLAERREPLPRPAVATLAPLPSPAASPRP